MKDRYTPYKVGDEVDVIRHTHGWNDGATGIITQINVRPTKTHYYTVKNLSSGEEYEVKHTRDLKFK